MAKQQVALAEVEGEERVSLLAQIAELKEQLAAAQAEKQAMKSEKRAVTPRKQADTERVQYAWTTLEHALYADPEDSGAVQYFCSSLTDAGLLNEKQAATLALLSGVGTPSASQKQVGDYLRCNTWQVYNLRREAVQKIVGCLTIPEETVYDVLKLRRGQPKPERHTQYWPKKQATTEDE